MNTRFLFPHSFKLVGWILLIPALALLVLLYFFQVDLPLIELPVLSLIEYHDDKTTFFNWTYKNELNDEIMAATFIIGAILVAFSKEKIEDEFISKLRLESLLWATYINYALLLLSILFIYEAAFFDVMIWNMFTLLIIFLLRYHIILYFSAKVSYHEK
ncbi:hypothetical protein [Xanthocytophaga agilis]|uniref:Uncharacterized protein n=1 Tax=Xanthocytophaga agilis TaxID=3048010 RepID=A0AAE3UCE3_9BACT|nr:hypothetical protein [Xanthocytophaga agilis]MDJ1500025.1 hypothetical protein [Xanthocytophaga agilis]